MASHRVAVSLFALLALSVQATAALTLPTQYHALVAKRVGSSFSEVATVVERPMPSVGAGEVCVKVTHAGVNGGCETFR